MGKEIRNCQECGKAFGAYPSSIQKFCSNECYRLTASREMKEGTRHRPSKPQRGTITPCEVCGKPVYGNKSEREKGVRRYCSHDCHNVAQSKETVIKACVTCGKELRLKPSQAAIQFCSKECESVKRTLRPLERTYNGRAARKNANGYVEVYEPTHPNKSLKGWQMEHRVVVEKALGRYLESHEVVHHINGVKDDNRLDNLEVMNAIDHAALSARDFRDSINRQLDELAEYKRRFGALD